MNRYLAIKDKANNSITFIRENERGNFDKKMITHKSIFEMSDEGLEYAILYLVKKGVNINILPF